MNSFEKWFVIRADSGTQIGYGHVMRCLALAEWAEKQGFSVCLITNHLNDLIESRLGPGSSAYTLEVPAELDQALDAGHCLEVLAKETKKRERAPSFITVDHYKLSKIWESAMNEVAPILVIDDLADRFHDCSWLVDQTFGRKRQEYMNLVDSRVEVMTGPDYALLRPEFVLSQNTEVQTSLSESRLNVLVTLGGADLEDAWRKLLSSLPDNIDGKVVSYTLVLHTIGSVEALANKWASQKINVKLVSNVRNMAALMRNSDLCVGAVGSTTWERFAMSLPSVLIVVAENQMYAAQTLQKADLIKLVDIELDLPQFERQLLQHMRHLTEPSVHSENRYKISQVCSGQGANKLLEIIKKSSEK